MALLRHCEHYPTLIDHFCQLLSQTTTVEWQKKSYYLTGVEVDYHDLHVLQIPIFAAQPLPANLGRTIHALCFHWLSLANAAKAERSHQQNTLPFSLASGDRAYISYYRVMGSGRSIQCLSAF
jgi:CRISPR-associated endoribonuclease Cas6